MSIRYLRTPLDLPLVLFLVSAFIGYWASFDPQASQAKLLLIIAAVVVYYVIILLRRTQSLLKAAVWLFLAVVSAFALYFLSQTDFTAAPTKFAPLTAIGIIFNRVLPRVVAQSPQHNMVAFSLEIGLPFAVALAIHSYRAKEWLSTLAASAVALWLAFGLAMTTSRGAYLAYIVVCGIAAVGFVASKLAQAFRLPQRIWIPVLVIVGALLVITLARLVNVGELINSVGAVDSSGSTLSRLELYAQTWQLIQEYFFTGAGLGVFPLVLSAYSLVIEVPFLGHAHNLFLAVWIEQGVLGFLALVWLVIEFYVWAFINRAKLNWLSYAGIFATSVWLLHGMVDTALYQSRALPLMFAPAAFAIASVGMPAHKSSHSSWRSLFRVSRPRIAVAVITTALIILAIVLGWDSNLSMWEANLGSVAEARSELGNYKPNDRITELRRTANLTRAEQHFGLALKLNPENAVANSRMGLIQLTLGDYQRALQYLEPAWRANSDNRATRKALGYAYAWNGELDKATRLLRPIPEAGTEMDQYSFWWKTQGQPLLAQRAADLSKRLQHNQ